MENRFKISIIILCTNNNQLNEAKKWIKKQSVYSDIECIFLDNSENQYPSAAKGLNAGAKKSNSEICIFMHQDLYLWDMDICARVYDFLIKNPHAILGVAGVPKNSDTVSDIFETENAMKRLTPTEGKTIEVDSVDECFIAMTRERWNELKFDPICCDGWHCYGLDICLKNRIEDGRNYVIPAEILHESKGNEHNRVFRKSVGRLIKKYYDSEITIIHGCCVNVKCKWLDYIFYCFKENIKDRFKIFKRKTSKYY